MQQPEGDDQADRPGAKQDEQRQRPEQAEQSLTLPRKLDERDQPAPAAPKIAVEEPDETIAVGYAPREQDGFEGIDQYGCNGQETGDRDKEPHRDLRLRSLFFGISGRPAGQFFGFSFAHDASLDELVMTGMPRVDRLPLALLADRFSTDVSSLYGLVNDPGLDLFGLAHPSLPAGDRERKCL